MKHNPQIAKSFITLISIAGLCCLVYAITHAGTWHLYETLALIAITVVASRMNMKLPGLTGNMSVNLPFLMLAAAELNLPEALAVALVSTAVQCVPKDGSKIKYERVLFNLSLMTCAVAAAWQVFRMGTAAQHLWLAGAVLLPFAALTLFLMQTVPVSVIITLTSGGQIGTAWTSIARMTLPYYALSAGMASMMLAARQHVGWHVPLVVLPLMYGIYRSYQTYFGRESAQALSMAKAAGH
jgi:hypothetical protein